MPEIADTSFRAAETGGKKSLKERAVTEFQKFAVITLYLWILFAVFGLHKQLLLGRGVSGWQQGFALINALVFAKVILLGEVLKLGRGGETHRLVWIVLRKSLIFAVLIVVFHIVEEAIRAWFQGHPVSEAITGFGGSWLGVVAYGAIFFVMLIPFWAFQEASEVLGPGVVWNLFLRPRPTKIEHTPG
jgi:hypothetical protein